MPEWLGGVEIRRPDKRRPIDELESAKPDAERPQSSQR